MTASSARFAAAAAIFLTGLLAVSSPGMAAETGAPAPRPAPTLSPRPAAAPPGTEAARAAWRAALSRVPLPRKGCFTAVFPKTTWQEIPCTTNKLQPYPPAPGGGQPNVVGGGVGDFSGKVSSGHVHAAEGSFDDVSGVSAEIGNLGGKPPAVLDAYALQLNANTFKSPACAGATLAGCRGWQQFVYSNTGSLVMQYWLIGFGPKCPVGGNWAQTPMSPNSCFKDGINQASPPGMVPAANLKQFTLAATATAGGSDTVMLTVNGQAFSFSNDDGVVGLAAGWQEAEFNVFGDAFNSQAHFNDGSTIVVRTTVHNGTNNPLICDPVGFTGESNDLTLAGTAAVPAGPAPAIVFTESNTLATAAGCAVAQGIGDTHLTTFSGLLYDFQASGDFLLAQVGADFVVQNRQASGAPRWPNAAVNTAVATRMGKTVVAICLPNRLFVDGEAAQLGDGKALALAGGVNIARRGEVYLVSGPDGDSLRAALHANAAGTSYINVSLGLGHWPEANVHGLLANPDGDVNALALRSGTVLHEPVPFAELYGRYGDSWRVPPAQSLLTPCGARPAESGNPAAPFYARDLEPGLAERSRAICVQAGVKPGALLDACTLDVAVLGSETAARIYVHAPAPVAVGLAAVRRAPDK